MIIPRYLFASLRCFFAVALLLLLTGAKSPSYEPRILVLGDSISAAYGMSLEQGWVAQMETQLSAIYPQVAVANASISGETTVGGLSRLPALLEAHKPQLVLVELGGNDGLRGYPLKTLRANLADMVALAQQAGAAVILLPMEIPPNYGKRYTTGFRESFQSVAESSGAIVAPFILENVALDAALMQADGLHPTAAAQPQLLNSILPTVLYALKAL